MKKLKLLIFLLSFFFVSVVNAKELITFDKEIEYDTSTIQTIYSSSKDYIIINNNTLLKYDSNNKLLISKEIEDLTNQKIINYQDNYLLVGLNNNTLKVYLLDQYLQVINQQETSEIINKTVEFKLYEYANKIYILLTNNNTLIDNNIYEVDQELNINKNSFSSYDTKEILKSDYYLYLKNNEVENDIFNKYQASASYLDKTVLIGTNSNNEAIIKILINNETIVNKNYPEYQIFKNIEIINDRLLILTENNLLIINLNGNIEKELNIENIHSISKIGNKLLLFSNNKILSYNYDCNITTTESDYGTITIAKTSSPYEKVSFKTTVNSGYKIDNIIVTDTENNQIKVDGNSFIMPTNDIKIEVQYTTSINNPETVDYILVIIVIFIISTIVLVNNKKKVKWLE